MAGGRGGGKSDGREMVRAPFMSDKRFKRKYARQLIEYVNQVVRPDEQNLYKEIVQAIIEENPGLDKPQDLLMLDTAVYDFLRIKRIQSILMERGDVDIVTAKSGREYVKSNEAGYLLNAVETQMRQMLKELGLTRSEREKRKLGVDAQDFATYMSEPVEAEIVEDEDESGKKPGKDAGKAGKVDKNGAVK